MGIMQGGTGNESFMVAKSDPLGATLGTWRVGDTLMAFAWAWDSEGNASLLRGALTLEDISAVPEPATMILLGPSLLTVLRGARRREPAPTKSRDREGTVTRPGGRALPSGSGEQPTDPKG